MARNDFASLFFKTYDGAMAFLEIAFNTGGVQCFCIFCLCNVFYLFRLATRNGSSHCIGPKKNRRLGLFVFVVSSSVRLFICLIACLFVCLVLFSFVSFSVSLLFDDRCSDKCQNLDEYFDKHRQFYHFLCVPLKPTTFGVSFPEVIMIANVFTPRKHQILCFSL